MLKTYNINNQPATEAQYSALLASLKGQENYRCIESVDGQGMPVMTTSYIAKDLNGAKYQIYESGEMFNVKKLDFIDEPKGIVPVLKDVDILNAIKEKAEIAFAKVLNVNEKHSGTRSHISIYDLGVGWNVLGQLQGKIAAVHYGVPLMKIGNVYVLSLISSKAFSWQILSVLEIPKTQLDASIKAHDEALLRLQNG